jgi:hypothetical protein
LVAAQSSNTATYNNGKTTPLQLAGPLPEFLILQLPFLHTARMRMNACSFLQRRLDPESGACRLLVQCRQGSVPIVTVVVTASTEAHVCVLVLAVLSA